MKQFRDLEYIDTANYAGYIGFSTPGWVALGGSVYMTCYEDRPLLRVTMTGTIESVEVQLSAASIVHGGATFTKDYGSQPVWDMTDSLRAGYIRRTYPSSGIADNHTPATLTISGYDSHGSLVATRTIDVQVSARTLNLTAGEAVGGPYFIGGSLPSRFRIPGSSLQGIDPAMVQGCCIGLRGPRAFSLAIYAGTASAVSLSYPGTQGSYLMQLKDNHTEVRLVDAAGDTYRARVEHVDDCPQGVVILRWFSRLAGGWKCLTLDYVREYAAAGEMRRYEQEYAGKVDAAGSWQLVARMPDATYNDWLYYCDILTAEDIQLYRPALNTPTGYIMQADGVSVQLSGTWKPGEVKHMDITINPHNWQLWE